MWLWSYALAAIGLLGLFVAGRRNRLGWAIGFIAQPLWIAYAIVTAQHGFLLTAVAYGYVYAVNWLRWGREEATNDGEDRTADARG